MSKYLIARIIMLPNSTVHIALLSKTTINCSRNSLLEFLSDPFLFLKEAPNKYKITTPSTNPVHRQLEQIPGLTLLKAYNDNTIICRFPKLFQALLNNFDNTSEKPFNLKEYVSGLEFSDEKHFLMKFFYDFTNEPRSELTIERALGMESDEQNEIMQETFNTVFNSLAPAPAAEPHQNPVQQTFFNPKNENDMLTVAECADKFGVGTSTVTNWIYSKKVPGAIKKDGKWYIPNDFKPIDGRGGRGMPRRHKKGIEKYVSSKGSYEVVQEHIKNEEAISEKLRPFIRSYEELQYYKKNRYSEVNWDGKPALIIDINPDYYCERLGLTNRQLICEKNESPVVPDRDDTKYIIHHIGQKANSPFAIIPEDDHVIGNKIFHLHADAGNNEALHGSTFEAQKKAFWLRYIKEYDKCGSYLDIQRTDLCHSAEKKRRVNREKENAK